MQAESILPSLTGSLVGLAIAAALAWVTPTHEQPAPPKVAEPECKILVAAPAQPELVPIELEWRTIEADANVPAWEQFIYTRDASARQAFASEPYRASDTRPRYQMVQDGFGGVWAMRDGEFFGVSAGEAAPMRDVWLLPHNAAFRGVIDKRSL